MPDAAARRRRDPEARRREIVTAAAELIVEVGVDALTHRMIAARAGVPLGATTQYFATLDDLRADGLRHLAVEVEARIDGVRAALAERGATPAVLTELIVQGLADARAMEADRAVVTAAIDDPQLRELARRWSTQLSAFLAEEHGAERASAAAVFIDGVLWHSRIHDEPLPPELIEHALAAILHAPAT
ncbi:TetR family transcriptional regulator [Microbacterium sp.]|uniref:TetR/AcrR family transcriptional regulator n=1 Tax=Microbacterium sp. TaxID=51671 RepID=UPI002810B76F|nr:TetR family transcriptional regulator [Microbacterium sp.]